MNDDTLKEALAEFQKLAKQNNTADVKVFENPLIVLFVITLK